VTEAASRHRPSAGVLATALQPWGDIAETVHRRLLHFADHEENWEILWVGSGAARVATWWIGRFGRHAAAIDPNARAVAWAERAARSAGLGPNLTVQVGHAGDLPHADAVYDLVITSLLFDPAVDPPAAMAEATRVVRHLQPVVFAVPVWSGTPAEEVEGDLAAIGVRPRFLTAWKQLARDAGLVDVSAEAVTTDGRWLAPGIVGPVARAWRSAGLDGARTVLSGPVTVFRRLVERRVIDLAMVRGSRWKA
jgi:SAM-dependent methyltransferase